MVLHDVQFLINQLQAIGLKAGLTERYFSLVLPYVRVVKISQCTLLGALLSEEGYT